MMDLVSFAVIVLTVTGYTDAQVIDTAPDNAVGIVKGTSHFLCEIKFGSIQAVTWEFNDDIVYSYLDGEEDYPHGCNKYSVTKEGNVFTLTVRDLMLKDGGEYTCLTITEAASANLIVLSMPVINGPEFHPVEGDTAMYICEAYFGGPKKEDFSADLYPQLQMSLEDDQLTGQVFEQRSKGRKFYLLTQHHTMVLKPKMNQKLLECKIKTSFPPMIVTGVTEMNVSYTVRNVRYSPIQAVYEVGTAINCTAEGNPKPSFRWENIAAPGDPVIGSLLIITVDMAGRNSWKCIASNIVNEKDRVHHDKLLVNFEAVLHGGAKTANAHWKISLSVAVPVCLVIVIVAILIMVRCRRSDHQGNQIPPLNEKQKNEEETNQDPSMFLKYSDITIQLTPLLMCPERSHGLRKSTDNPELPAPSDQDCDFRYTGHEAFPADRTNDHWKLTITAELHKSNFSQLFQHINHKQLASHLAIGHKSVLSTPV